MNSAPLMMRARSRSRALVSIPYWRDDDATWARGRGSRAKRVERRRVRRAEQRSWLAQVQR